MHVMSQFTREEIEEMYRDDVATRENLRVAITDQLQNDSSRNELPSLNDILDECARSHIEHYYDGEDGEILAVRYESGTIFYNIGLDNRLHEVDSSCQ